MRELQLVNAGHPPFEEQVLREVALLVRIRLTKILPCLLQKVWNSTRCKRTGTEETGEQKQYQWNATLNDL